MAVVVIAGGIDLSVAAMMAVEKRYCRRLMAVGDGEAVVVVLGVL